MIPDCRKNFVHNTIAETWGMENATLCSVKYYFDNFTSCLVTGAP